MQLYASDCLSVDGDDLRKLPLHLRKTNLARLLTRHPEGIFISDFERGEIAARQHLPRRFFSSWIKVKNRPHPAKSRVKESFAVAEE